MTIDEVQIKGENFTFDRTDVHPPKRGMIAPLTAFSEDSQKAIKVEHERRTNQVKQAFPRSSTSPASPSQPSGAVARRP